MPCLLLNFVNNLTKRIHKIKCKHRRDLKNVKFVELNIKITRDFLNIQTLKII